MNKTLLAFCNLRDTWEQAKTLKEKMEIASSVYHGMGKSNALTELMAGRQNFLQRPGNSNPGHQANQQRHIPYGIPVPHHGSGQRHPNSMDVDISAMLKDRDNTLQLVRKICWENKLCFNCLK